MNIRGLEFSRILLVALVAGLTTVGVAAGQVDVGEECECEIPLGVETDIPLGVEAIDTGVDVEIPLGVGAFDTGVDVDIPLGVETDIPLGVEAIETGDVCPECIELAQ